jgi:hypothetical protein
MEVATRLLLVLAAPAFVLLKNPMTVKLDKLDCDYNPKFCVNSSCKLKAINRTSGAVTVGCYFVRPLASVNLDIGVYSKSSSNVYQPTPLRFHEDLCALVVGGGNPLVKNTFTWAAETIGRSLPTCPMSGKNMLENVLFDSNFIPSNLLPTGQYRLHMRKSTGSNDTIMLVKYYFTVTNPFY